MPDLVLLASMTVFVLACGYILFFRKDQFTAYADKLKQERNNQNG